jgi:uncharacterized protein YndB with AHSA1/START domain
MTQEDAVVIERIIDAPVELVWQMWTDPEEFAAWYGPMGAIVSVEKMDVRAGGARSVSMTMETPGGPMKMTFVGEFVEAVENKRLVYTEVMSGGPAPGHDPTEVRIELADLGGRTRLTLTHVGIPAGSPGEAGWQMAMDKLVQQLATRS